MTPDRPANETEIEIEVTPEMIEAGVEILLSFHNERDDPKETVKSIFFQLKRFNDSPPSEHL